ncbi:MAG: hypothetical protein R6V06_04235 [Kiritimatiellia bacterium]
MEITGIRQKKFSLCSMPLADRIAEHTKKYAKEPGNGKVIEKRNKG